VAVKAALRGKITDMGDVIVQEFWHVKGRQLFNIRLHIGAPADTTAADRVVHGPTTPATGKADLIMDLMADQKVPLSVEWTDEIGNPTTAPAAATVTYTVDDAAIINLTDNGDGTAVAAAVGTLGTATVHVDADVNGDIITGDLQIVVVAGLAERLNVVAGPPEEVTPDV
jgi:hypothetical protein